MRLLVWQSCGIAVGVGDWPSFWPCTGELAHPLLKCNAALPMLLCLAALFAALESVVGKLVLMPTCGQWQPTIVVKLCHALTMAASLLASPTCPGSAIACPLVLSPPLLLGRPSTSNALSPFNCYSGSPIALHCNQSINQSNTQRFLNHKSVNR